MSDLFQIKSPYQPAGDQPEAIAGLTDSLKQGRKHQVLLGVTGSGKTFTMAQVIQNIQKPTLILAHNKTLAAQLYSEFKEYFPNNAVSYFVSYYDYYQPEAYVPHKDLYIEKETDINEDIERYRNAATQMALSRKDVIIVASVSCIYGLGDPEDYTALARELKVGQVYPRTKLLIHLTDMQYYRSEYDFYPGLFRVRGDTIDIYLVAEELALRIEFFGDEIESLKLINPISAEIVSKPTSYKIYPAKQFVTPYDRVKQIIPQIQADLQIEKEAFLKAGKILEANRIEQRVNYDIEMLQEVGYCTGIENYSRYLDGRPIGSPPSTLLEYLGEDWLLIVDESHMTLPQVRGMYNGDRARKEILVNYGFRLKAALDNRPLKFTEFFSRINQAVYVSATPTEYEISLAQSAATSNSGAANDTGVYQQIIRPTGLLDPLIYLRPSFKEALPKLTESLVSRGLTSDIEKLKEWTASNQIDDLIIEIKNTVAKGQRVLITTLTKRMAEELSNYLGEINIKVQYLHSDIDALERVAILKNLRLGSVDVVVGINLLREGLDLPEVSLVAILDADKEGFLRSEVSLTQTMGRAARHSEGRVIMYADKITDSMYKAIKVTRDRREIQTQYNLEHNITPTTIISSIKADMEKQLKPENNSVGTLEKQLESYPALKPKDKKELISDLKVKMEIFADALEFEKAALIRDFLQKNGLKNSKKH